MIYYANHASILVQTVRESPYFKIHCSLFYKQKFLQPRFTGIHLYMYCATSGPSTFFDNCKPGSGVGETTCLNKNYMFLNKNLQDSDLPVDRFGQAYSVWPNTLLNREIYSTMINSVNSLKTPLIERFASSLKSWN